MGVTISKSVGKGGANLSSDTKVIQSLLNQAANSNLDVDGKCGPKTIAAIMAFQQSFFNNPDGRVDVGGTSWQKLLDALGAAQAAAQSAAKPISKAARNSAIVAAIDADPTLSGAGIIIINKTGVETAIREGPRSKYVYISAIPAKVKNPSPRQSLPSFWDRWRSSVLSCSSAIATGTVITLSGGTASVVVGAFAVNSAALCGMNLGKAIEYDAWQEFELYGGGKYKAWLTIETAMSMADLFNGFSGAVGALKAWEKAGKLSKLAKRLGNKRIMSRKKLLQAIREVDPSFNANLAAKGGSYISKSKLVIAGKQVLTANNFRSVTNQQAQVIIGAIGNAFTLAGTPDTWNSAKKTYEIWLVQYDDKPD